MKLKEIKLPAKVSYAADFFAEVAKASEGRFFLYEEAATGNAIRSAAYNYGRRLKRKFSVVTVKDETGAEKFAVSVTSKTRKPRKKVVAAVAEVETPEQITYTDTNSYGFGEEGQ